MTSPGQARLADVSCDFHGPMLYRFALDGWECAGFDGEGCDVELVRAEDVFGRDRDPGIPGVTVRYRAADAQT